MNEILQLPPHQILLTTREMQNFSIEKVAADLHLSVSVIKALEEGSYDLLYGDAFVCGVLRSYASLLGLDADIIVTAYKQSRPQPVQLEQVPEVIASNVHLSLQHKKYRTDYGIAAVFVLVVIFGFFTSKEQHLSGAKVDSSIAIDTAIGTTIVNSIDEMPMKNPTQDLLPEVAIVHEDRLVDIYQAEDSTVSLKKPDVSERQSLLNFTFSADCWVEVRDGNNQKIFASMQRAQERLELQGKPPFIITLGYAPGVALSYNSEPVNIDANHSNVAKLVLGNS